MRGCSNQNLHRMSVQSFQALIWFFSLWSQHKVLGCHLRYVKNCVDMINWKTRGGGGYSNYFLMGCAARGLKPLPISKDFSPSKNGWFKAFFRIFANRDPFLRVFLPQNGWFYHFFVIFAKWDPLLRIFLTKMGPMSKDFCWKSNPFGRHIPVCLNMWVPPSPPVKNQI